MDPLKQQLLEDIIASLGSAVVAFSGGADSTLLLAVCLRTLGSSTFWPSPPTRRPCRVANSKTPWTSPPSWERRIW
jgi:NH3-dependent NAD+ synthetase